MTAVRRAELLALLGLLALGVGLAAGDVAPPAIPYLSGYDVALVTLDPPRVVQGHSHQRAYLIRLYGYFPPQPGGRQLLLYFGDQRAPAYEGAGSDVYLLVYDRAQLDAWAGREIRYRWSEDGELLSLDIKFEPRRFDLTTPVPLAQALARKPIKPAAN